MSSGVTCEVLPHDPHGKYTNANCTKLKTFYNDSCELECALGYKVEGDPVKMCQLNGDWNSNLHCIGKNLVDNQFSLMKMGFE